MRLNFDELTFFIFVILYYYSVSFRYVMYELLMLGNHWLEEVALIEIFVLLFVGCKGLYEVVLGGWAAFQ